MDKISETMTMVTSQYSAMYNKYNASWKWYRWLLHLNTQNLLSKKWQITAEMYPRVTDTSAGRKWLVIQTTVRSMTAVLPPTAQNLVNRKIRSFIDIPNFGIAKSPEKPE
jgi:hypothetical protein